MYETESNNRTESLDQLPAAALEQFRGFRDKILARTLLPWGEHCTECVWPTCYTTCDLYSPREDGRCRRFLDGQVRLDCPGSANSYLLKVRFKRWGKLWAPGNIHLRPLDQADRAESRDRAIGSTLQRLPSLGSVRNFSTHARYKWKKRIAQHAAPSLTAPDFFVVECYNPGPGPIGLSLTIRSAGGSPVTIPFLRLIQVPVGFHRELISVPEIAARFNLNAPFSVDLTPNEIEDGATLYFGLIDFVSAAVESAPRTSKKPTLKCIVWDLDNTMWDGILVEDGIDKLVLKPGIAEIIRNLDRRGILHSIASKNNAAEAMAVLQRHGLEEYFLHPQISWNPKSEALKTIAARLNIGIDTLMLVDDSPFELAEVQAACPEAKTLLADRYQELPQLPECQVPETAESAGRRNMYRQEAVRETAAQSFAEDYLGFLRDCRIVIQIEPLSAANLERVHELTQRTNQMNFSGNRYELKSLREIAAAPHIETHVISCRDRFGSYGIVGFSVIDTREPRMTDLMFSCRIQAKRVEHAFLAHLLRRYAGPTGRDFWADYRKTPRNEPSGRVFQDMGFAAVEDRAGVTSLVFRAGQSVPEDGITEIQALGVCSGT